jgi:hypothetical protein
MIRVVESGDARSQFLADAEGCGFPGDLVTERDQTFGNACDCYFAGALCGTHVKVDIAGKVEAAFNRSLDSGSRRIRGILHFTGGAANSIAALSNEPIALSAYNDNLEAIRNRLRPTLLPVFPLDCGAHFSNG